MEENFDEILERGCLFDSPIRNKNRIRVRRKKSDSDFHLSIVNDMMFQIMMNNRSRFQFPCMLISLVFQIPYKTLLEEAEFYKEFIDREKLDSKGFICDCMIIYRDTIFNIEMNGNHTLARNQDYIHKAATIKNRRGKKIFKLMNY